MNKLCRGVWPYAPTFFLLPSVVLFTATPSFGGDVTGRVVGTDGEGIAQAVVFVQTLSSGLAPPAARTAEMDQVHKEFVPPVLPIMVGTEVRFPNRDQIQHHVYSFSRTKNFELPLYKGEDAPPVLFDKVGVVKIGCNIHDWMSAIILVMPNPYFAVTDETGKFVLHNLADGTYSLAVWHERSRAKPEDVAQHIQVREGAVETTFTLALSSARPRPANRGERGY